ncbi:hypothetical protein HZS_93 [Henneguya salminicola]|nr:hypothetical protein HZS_93 [Henneguya salminicola]
MTKTKIISYYCDRVKKYSAIIDSFDTSGIVGIFILPDVDSDLRTFVSNFTVHGLKQLFSASVLIKTKCNGNNIGYGRSQSFKPPVNILHLENIEIDEKGVVSTGATAIESASFYIAPLPSSISEFNANRQKVK